MSEDDFEESESEDESDFASEASDDDSMEDEELSDEGDGKSCDFIGWETAQPFHFY